MKVGTARRARQDPEFQLKHRVTGAAIIAAAAALGLALLLGEPGGGDGAGDAQTIRFDFGEAGTADSTVTAATESGAVDTEVAVTALPDAGVPLNSDDAAAASTGWAVQVAALADQAGVAKMVAKLNAGGFPVNTVPPKSGGKLTLIWLGPYPDRRAANNARRRAIAAGAGVGNDAFVDEARAITDSP